MGFSKGVEKEEKEKLSFWLALCQKGEGRGRGGGGASRGGVRSSALEKPSRGVKKQKEEKSKPKK